MGALPKGLPTFYEGIFNLKGSGKGWQPSVQF